jgi:hypothetical protein
MLPTRSRRGRTSQSALRADTIADPRRQPEQIVEVAEKVEQVRRVPVG